MNGLKKIVAYSLGSFGYRISRVIPAASDSELPATTAPEKPVKQTTLEKEFDFISKLPGFLDINAYGLFCQLDQYFPKSRPAILEIGIFCGKSYVALGMAFKNPALVVGVDPFYEDFKDSPVLENEGEYLEQASRELSREERLGLLNAVLSESKKFRPSLPRKFKVHELTQDDYFVQRSAMETFDVVHIDGEHTFQAVYDFFDEADKVLNAGALVIVDDFLNPGFPGISEAVHTHPIYKTSLKPVFYGFNKAVFLYKPKDTDAKRLLDSLVKHYRSIGRDVRPYGDGSVGVQ